MNSGLYSPAGLFATACDAAWANLFDEPTMKLSKVYSSFHLYRALLELGVHAHDHLAVLDPARLDAADPDVVGGLADLPLPHDG